MERFKRFCSPCCLSSTRVDWSHVLFLEFLHLPLDEYFSSFFESPRIAAELACLSNMTKYLKPSVSLWSNLIFFNSLPRSMTNRHREQQWVQKLFISMQHNHGRG